VIFFPRNHQKKNDLSLKRFKKKFTGAFSDKAGVGGEGDKLNFYFGLSYLSY